MAERNIDATLKSSLIANDPFDVLHLVKFEKPKPSSKDGVIAGIATDYTYITDAAYNIPWDDGSLDSLGNANGTQTYIANKLLNLGGVQETIEARASSMSLKLSTIALGNTLGLSAAVNSGSGRFETSVDLAEYGFREGDKIKLESASNTEHYVRFDRFTKNSAGTPNAWVYFTDIDGSISNDASPIDYTITVASEELDALTRGKDQTLYSSYINREVFIYRAHLHPTTGEVIGAPFLLFRGIIANGSLQESPDREASITWALSSHWGDFVRVQGRITSDANHRALDVTGKSDRDALIRPEYATDYGFVHSEKALNLLGTFQVQELRYKTKKRGGLAGLLGGKKVVEYYETVDRNVDLRFNLAAQYLPVVYGVQKVSSIPIFADIDVEDPKQVYVIYALCEGEIGGIYDIHVEDQSSVCLDEMDEAVRNSTVAEAEENNVDVICYGRADRGDVITGGAYVNETPRAINFQDFALGPYAQYLRDGAFFGRRPRGPNWGLEGNTTGQQGLTHETTYTFETPIDANFVVHTGKPDQDADEIIVGKAQERSFKIQSDYFDGDPSNYWSTSHRLLDTANVTCRFTLGEGEETIPEYEFVVKGKYVECYNYDHSFKHNPSASSESADNFNLGDTVDIKVGGVTTHTGVQIIDKWTMYDRQGNADVRFRWRTSYPAGGDTLVNLGSSNTVQMVSGGNTWSMITTDYSVDSGNISSILPVEATGASYTDNAGEATLTLTLNTGDANYSAMASILGSAESEKAFVALTNAPSFSYSVISFSGGVLTLAPHSAAGNVLTEQDFGGSNLKVFISNAVNVSGAPAIALVEDTIEVTRVTNNVPYTISKKIHSTSGSIVFTSTPYARDLVPGLTPDWTAVSSADSYALGPANDERVSINPVMQILDYVTSIRYGRGLHPTKDLNLETWLESGRLCDDNSKVKVAATSAPSLQAIYSLRRGDGTLVFQGRVVEVNSRTYGGSTYYEVTFDDPIGKLGYKWNTWRTYKAGDIVWGFNKASIAPDGVLTQAAFEALAALPSISLTKVEGSGPTSISISTARLGGSKNTNNVVRGWTTADEAFSAPGYSLHDSDDVKYWKYIGWDEPEQRYVTRHQMNQVVNTNTPIFDNINSMLIQFNGVLRYSNGKYDLDIKTAQPASFTPGINSLSENDIIGDIKISDKGQKNSYNSISASIIDPQNKFASRSISFFNSEYLKEDRGVPKQGTFSMPGISNYFTARTNIVQFLDQSRYGLEINFTADPKAYTLLAGEVVVLNYKRFKWVDKAFRLTTLNIQPNGLVDVIAEEHNNDAYLIDYSDRSFVDQFGNLNNQVPIDPPTNLQATQNLRGEIQLTWDNTEAYDEVKFEVEIFAVPADRDSLGEYILDSGGNHTGGDFVDATFLAHVDGNRYVHDGFGSAPIHAWYYWIRYAVPSYDRRVKVRYSPFTPLSTEQGVLGIGVSSANLDAITVVLTNETHALPANDLGVVYTYENSGTDIYVYEGANILPYQPVSGGELDIGTWEIADIATTNIVADGGVTDQGDFARVGNHSGMSPSGYASVTYHIVGRRAILGEDIDIYKTQTLSSVSDGADGDQGSAGLDAKAVKLTASDYVIMYDENEINPQPTVLQGILLTATATNVDTPWFKFTGAGLDDEVSFSEPNSGDDPGTKTFFYEVPPNYFNTPRTIRVDVSNGDQTALAFDTIAIFATHPGTDGEAGVDGRTVRMTAGTLIFTYDTGGTNPENPIGDLSDITKTLIRAWPHNFSGTPYYEFFVDDVSVQASSTNQFYTYTAPANSSNMPQKIEVEMREGSAVGTIVARDQISISALQYGSDSLTVILSNEAHAIPVTNTGTFDFNRSGTTIRVFEGAQELEYDPAWNRTDPGKYDFEETTGITDINVIAGTPQLTAGTPVDYVTMPALAGWDGDLDSEGIPTELTGVITYEIEGKRVDGRDFTLDKQQSFSLSLGGVDGANGTVFNLYMYSTGQVFKYDASGTPIAPTEITFTVIQQGSSEPIVWTTRIWNGTAWVNTQAYYFDSPTPGLSTTLSEATFQQILDDEPTAVTDAVRVMAHFDEGGDFYIDSVVVQKLQDGVATPVGQLTNPTHITPANSDGTGFSLDDAGGTFRVWDGLTEVTGTGNGTDDTVGPIYSVYLGDDEFDNLLMTINNISGVYSLSGAPAWDAASTAVAFTLQAQYKGTYIRQVYTIIKGKAGADGADGADGTDAKAVKLTAGKLTFVYDANEDLADDATTVVTATDYSVTPLTDPWFKFFLNDVEVQHIDNDNTYTYSAPATLSNPDKIEVEMREGQFGAVLARDQISIAGLKQGSDSITIVLSNEAHSVPSDADGSNPILTGSGTTIRVFEGSTELIYDGVGTSNGTWDIGIVAATSVTSGGIVDSGNYATVQNLTGMSANTGSLAFPISGTRSDGSAFGPITRTQSFAKSRAGTDGAAGANGEDAIVIVLSNDSHTIPTDADGSNGNYAGSGTTIRVFEGATELSYDGVGTASGTWDIGTIVDTNIIVGSTTDSGLFATIGDASSMAADTASIEFPISGTRLDGTSFGPITKKQSFAKSKKGDFGEDAKTVKLIPSSQVIRWTPSGTLEPGQSITITAEQQNGEGTLYYRFKENSSGTYTTRQNSQSNTLSLLSAYWPGPSEVTSIQVTLEEGAGGPVVATDVVSIYGIQNGQDGASGVIAILSNETHSIPAAGDGTTQSSDYVGSGTTIRVFEGSTEMIYGFSGAFNHTWAIGTIVDTNITVGSITDSGLFATIGDASAMAVGSDTASIEFPIFGKTSQGVDFNITKIQSFSKVKGGGGEDAKTVKLIPSSQVIRYSPAGSEDPSNQSIIFSTEQQNGVGTLYYEFQENSTGSYVTRQNTTTNTFTLNDLYEPGPSEVTSVKVQLREGSSGGTIVATDVVSIYGIQNGADGEDALILTYTVTKQSVTASPVIAAESDGTGYFTYSGTFDANTILDGQLRLKDPAGNSITSGVTFDISETGVSGTSVRSKTKNGLLLEVSASTGAFAFSGASWTSSMEDWALKATLSGVVYEISLTIYKALGTISFNILIKPSLVEGSANTGLHVASNGLVYKIISGSDTGGTSWNLSTQPESAYDVRYTLISGNALDVNNANTFKNLGGGSLTKCYYTSGPKEGEVLVEINRTDNDTLVYEKLVTIKAT